jgi:hypothetical protein
LGQVARQPHVGSEAQHLPEDEGMQKKKNRQIKTILGRLIKCMHIKKYLLLGSL